MRALKRARAILCGALLLALMVLVAEFPLASLVHAHSAADTAAAELAAVHAENAALSRQLTALRSGSAVAALAHEEYGLVLPNESSLVVVPGKTTGASRRSGAATAPLGATTIPQADIVPSDAPLSPPGTGEGSEGSFWHRLLERLEFWNPSN